MADAAGIDFLLPVGRWKGYGGETNFEGATLETTAWACGLLAQTERITVFATVHAPLVHPVFAAKQFVTADHVGRGRFGLNIVCGWNQDEFDMFGVEQREHDDRYAYGASGSTRLSDVERERRRSTSTARIFTSRTSRPSRSRTAERGRS